MKRIIKVLVVTALMMVLMALTMAPAFANGNGNGNNDDGNNGNGWGDGTPQGYGTPVSGENSGCEDDEHPQAQGWAAGNCEYQPNYNR